MEAGVSGIHPETNTNPFALTACWYGPMAAGASDPVDQSRSQSKEDDVLGVETALMVDILTGWTGKVYVIGRTLRGVAVEV